MLAVTIVSLVHHHQSDEKEFDVFLSYVWSPTSDVEEVLMPSSQTGPDTDVEGGSTYSVYDTLAHI